MYVPNFALICLVSFVKAHSWAERAMTIGKDGEFKGEPGFPRGFGEESKKSYYLTQD
jgi:hypothetical protein